MRTPRKWLLTSSTPCWASLFVLLPMSFAQADTLRVRAYIDGRSRIVLDDDTAQWHHGSFAAPGRLNCDTGAPIEPTYLGGSPWFPQWPDALTCENRDCDCDSSLLTGGFPALPNTAFLATLEVVQCRASCSIVELPTLANGYRVVIEFDDNSMNAADWYEVVLHVDPVGPTLVVQGQHDPFLAGQPPGTTTHSDVAPDQSPLLVPLNVAGCQLVRFPSVTGAVSYRTPDPYFPPEGGFVETSAPDLGIAGFTMPICALLGVFLPDVTNPGSPPAALDFGTPGSRNFASLSPLLYQPFFIGDGRRDDLVTLQTFVVPVGATRLYLGVCDGFQWSDNLGSFQCTLEQASCGCGASTYCTAKVNSLGCLPRIAFSGTPSFSGPDDFVITAHEVINYRSGMLFWGRSAASSPLFGGTLCVGGPLQRTHLQDSLGNAGPADCSGTYAFFLTRDYMTLHGIAAGDTIYAQYFSRDPLSPSYPVGLTDAVQVTICP